MTLAEYIKGYLAHQKLQREFIDKIDAIGEQFYTEALVDLPHDGTYYYGGTVVDENEVVISWSWHGGYGATDNGAWAVPLHVFLDESKWGGFVQECEAKEKQAKENAEQQRKEEEIRQAQAVLARYGVK